jgi:hypothetical protein
MMRRRDLVLALLAAAWAGAPAAPRKAAQGAPPAANFLVEWRIRPAAAPAAGGGFTVGTRDAANGTSGFGAGATVVGTARAAEPQGVRVANGKEALLQFDTTRTRTVYDMVWSAQAQASSASGAAQGVASHEVVLHRIDGLRVTPHWSRGDTLALDLELTHVADATADGGTGRALAFRSTVQLSFDEWQSVADVGEHEQLQVRVSWR